MLSLGDDRWALPVTEDDGVVAFVDSAVAALVVADRIADRVGRWNSFRRPLRANRHERKNISESIL